MNKYIVYWFGVIMAIGIIAYNFFTTKATIVIDNYNQDQIIAEWILFSLTTFALVSLVYVLWWCVLYIGDDDE